MNNIKLILLLSLPFSIFSLPAYSLELFNNGKTELNFSGNASVYLLKNDNDSEINDGFSRYYFQTTHQLKDGWQAMAHLQWGVQVSNTDASIVVNHNGLTSSGPTDDPIWLRLGYVGVSHERFGRISMGKQWGVTYDLVTGVTDVFEIFGAEASGVYNFGTDGGFSGTGRAEQVIKYMNEFGDFRFGAQYQANNEIIENYNPEDPSAALNFDNGFGFSLAYKAPYSIGLAIGYNSTNISLTDGVNTLSGDDIAISASITYRSLDNPGLHIALVLTDLQNHEIDNDNRLMKEASGIELYSAYRFDNDLSLILGYNSLEDNSAQGIYHKEYIILGGKYYWDEQFELYWESKIDRSKSADGTTPDGEDAIGVGMMFKF